MNQRIETINELSELIAALLTTVRRLPPGPERHAALKQVGLFQVRLNTLAAQIPAREPRAAEDKAFRNGRLSAGDPSDPLN
jgi:hypothetical protein